MRRAQPACSADPQAIFIHETNLVLRRATFLGGASKPACGLPGVPAHPTTGKMHVAKVGLRADVTLPGRTPEPAQGFPVVGRRTGTGGIHAAEGVRRVGATLLGSTSIVTYGLPEILRHPATCPVKMAKGRLRASIPQFGRISTPDCSDDGSDRSDDRPGREQKVNQAADQLDQHTRQANPTEHGAVETEPRQRGSPRVGGVQSRSAQGVVGRLRPARRGPRRFRPPVCSRYSVCRRSRWRPRPPAAWRR